MTISMRTRSTFVQVGRGTDGVGKLVDFDKKQADIEYIQAPVGSVREVELSPQTRVFWFERDRGAWRVGRVDGGLISAEALKASEDHYPVRFPNGRDAHIPVSELNVRWAHPIEDPTDYL